MENIPPGTKVILLDLIGTTTPYSFFREKLPAYAREHLSDFIRRFRAIPEIKSALADLKRMHSDDLKAGENPPPWHAEDLESDIRCIADYCSWLIDHHSVASPLRYLEDFVWEEGYRNGTLRGEVYPEMPDAMAKLKSIGLQICTYSSGSVFSQQLIFSTTKFGDLLHLIRGFFDTSVGPKNEPESYSNISAILGMKPREIMYFSGSLEEVIAAGNAGLNAILMVRDGALGSEREGVRSMPDFSEFTRIGIGP